MDLETVPCNGLTMCHVPSDIDISDYIHGLLLRAHLLVIEKIHRGQHLSGSEMYTQSTRVLNSDILAIAQMIA